MQVLPPGVPSHTAATGVLVIDVSCPSVPRTLWTFGGDPSASDVDVDGHVAFTPDVERAARAFRVADPA
jgi:hypothetical protein